MKKTGIVLCLFSISLLASPRVQAMVFLDLFFGAQARSLDTPNGEASLGGDIAFAAFDLAEIGLGAEGELNVHGPSEAPQNYKVIHIYLLARLPFRVGPLTLYPVGRAGLAGFVEDSLQVRGSPAGGLYLSIGLGLRSPEFQLTPNDPFGVYAYVELSYGGVYNAQTIVSMFIGVGGRI